jgi:hypothetical protein
LCTRVGGASEGGTASQYAGSVVTPVKWPIEADTHPSFCPSYNRR